MQAPPTGGPPVAQREDPGRPPWEGADVLRPEGETYRAASRVPPSPHKVLHELMVCRTAALGGHAEQWPPCGCERYAYHAGRNRPGPQCPTLPKARWGEDRQAELLPVPYCHGVFTLPPELTTLVLANKRSLLTRLLRATSQTLLPFGRQNLGGQLGGIQVWHTWDQTLGAPCHVHCLGPGGARADHGTRGVPPPPPCLFPVHALGTGFRRKCLDALHASTTPDTLVFPAATAPLAPPLGCKRCTDQLYAKEGLGYAQRSLAGPGHVLDDLGRYTHRVAIATHRIVEGQDGQGPFTYRNRRQGNRGQTRPLEAHACIRRCLLPLVPHGLHRMRHIGFLANRGKARALRQCRQRLDQPAAPPIREKQTVPQWGGQWTSTDIPRCPSCGHGPRQRTPLPALPLRAGHPSTPPTFDSS